jgi:Ca2+-transporting ATPase
MGSGSEVTKQAAKMILTDDNFGTLVHAVELGRVTYDKIVSFVRVQMSQLLSLVLLFVAATVFNVNDGVALTPLMVLFVGLVIVIFPVIVVANDPGAPDIMSRPPRDPKVPITNTPAVMRWVLYGGVRFLAAFAVLVWGPDTPSTDQPSASMTMAFALIAFGAVLGGLVLRRDPASGLIPPLLKALAILTIPAILIVLATELPFMQSRFMTQPLTGGQWLVVLGLALLTAVVVEGDKWLRRRRTPVAAPVDVRDAVEPARAHRGRHLLHHAQPAGKE